MSSGGLGSPDPSRHRGKLPPFANLDPLGYPPCGFKACLPHSRVYRIYELAGSIESRTEWARSRGGMSEGVGAEGEAIPPTRGRGQTSRRTSARRRWLLSNDRGLVPEFFAGGLLKVLVAFVLLLVLLAWLRGMHL